MFSAIAAHPLPAPTAFTAFLATGALVTLAGFFVLIAQTVSKARINKPRLALVGWEC
jgi:hypothetical protein